MNSTNSVHPWDVEEFRRRGHEMVDFIADYYRDMETYPVQSRVEPGYLKKIVPSEVPEEAEPWEDIMKDVKEKIVPGVTHWQNPYFFAFYPANSSYPGMLGEMLSAAFNVIGFSWICSPACTELETIVLDSLAKLLNLPEDFLSNGRGGGAIQGTASEAVLVGLLAAKAKAMKALGADADPSKFVVYTSDQAHSSVHKACMIAGISDSNFRSVKTTTSGRFSMTGAALEKACEEDIAKGLIPIYCTATVGTTSSTAVDGIPDIGVVCQKHNIWLHVDAAYAGSAMICPEFRGLLNGVELADSFNFNPHKWLLTNFDCSPLWVKDRSSLLDALSITPEYLRNKHTESGLVTDYRDWQVPLGRRFRSLKLWFVLRSYGAERLRNHIRHHVKCAERFEEKMLADGRFELVVPRTLSNVVFRLKGTREQNEELLDKLNSTSKIMLTHTVLEGTYCIRFAVGAPMTDTRHVDEAWDTIAKYATDFIGK